MSNGFFKVAGLALCISLIGGPAQAFITSIPSSTQPGVIIKNLEGKERPRSLIEDVVTVPKMDENAAGVSDEKIFDLKTVVVDKSTTYKPEELKDTYSQYVGKKVSFADLNAIAHAMTRQYREDGYIFSRVIVPPQKINDGIVHFQAIEGHITEVEVVGNFKDSNGLIKEMANKIRAAGPANTKDIERYLLLIDDLPGITARSLVKPSATPGGGTLVIAVTEEKFEGSLSADNRGSKYLGPYEGTAVGAFNSVFGLHDRTTFRALAATQTKELKYGEVTHEEQIGSNGLRLTTRFAATKSDPGGDVKDLNINGNSKLLDVSATYPLMRGRQTNINLSCGFTGLNSDSSVLGVETGADRVRSVRADGYLDFTDPLRGVSQIDLQVIRGLKSLGATEDGDDRSHSNGKEGFTREVLTLTRVQDLWKKDLSLYLSGTAQGSHDALLASEEFTVGGSRFGRAYDGGEIAGDKGYAGVAELRYSAPVDNKYVQSFQAYAFLDGGRVFNIDPVFGEVANDSLASAGAGVRFNIINDYSGYVELDSPLTHIVKSESSKKNRIFFSILKRF